MTQRNIAIGIDPTRSTAGARVVKRDLEEIANAADKVQDKTHRARDEMGRFVSGTGAANDNIRRMQQSASGLSGVMLGLVGILKAAAALFATLIGAAVITALVKYSDTAKNLASQLRLVTNSSEELAAVQEKLFRVAQGGRSSYESTVQLYTKLARSAKDLGLSQDALLKITDTVNKAFVVSGASSQEADNAIRQLAQGLSAGALRGDEFNAVAEQAPRLLQAVAEYLGMGVGQLRAYAAEGKITADVLAGALFKSAEKINAEFAQMELTIGGAGTMLRNSLIRAVGELDARLGVGSGIANGIVALSTAVDSFVDNLEKIVLVSKIAAVALAAVFAPSILATAISLVTVVGTQLVGAFGALNAIILANPIAVVATAIVAAVAAVYYFRDEIQKAIGVDVWGLIKSTGNLIINSFQAAFEDVKFLWNTFPDIIEAAFTGAVNKVIEGVNAMNQKALEGVNWLREKIGMDPLNPEGANLTPYANPAAERLGESVADRNRRLNDIMTRDPLGDMYRTLTTPSVPGVPPGLPGEGATLPGGLGSGQSADQVKKYEEIVKGAQQSIQMQRLEAQTIGLTEQAARQMRLEQELLNKAANDNIALTPQQTQGLKDLAAQLSAAEQQTKDLKESFEFGRSTFKGFFSDLRSGLQNGEGFWKSFANAAVNALNKIIDRLLDKVLDGIFNSFFGGGTAGGTSAGAGLIGALGLAVTGRVGASVAPSAGASGSVALGAGGAVASAVGPQLGDRLSVYAQAIKNIESSGGNYSALGPITRSGDRAYGAYQVMGNNVGPWTQKHLGQAMTPQQFLGDRSAQDRVFQGEFGGYVNKYGPSGASQAWFGGPGSVGGSGKGADVLGTTGNSYVARFNSEVSKMTGAASSAARSVGDMSSASSTATQGLGSLGSGLSQFGQNLSTSFFPAAPSGGGGGFVGMFSKIFGSVFSPIGAQATLAASGSIFGLFDSGGYTGPGGRKDVAGLAHKGEVIFNQDDVRRHGGWGNVEAMRRGINAPANTNTEQKAGSSMSIGDVYVNVPEGTDTSDSEKIGKEVRQQMIQVIDERIADQQRTGGLLNRGAFS